MPAPIKTCVLGVGLAGLTFHAPFILALPEHFDLVAVLERNPASDGGKLKERFGITKKIHNTLEQVLADPEIELVVIGTPNATHYPYAKAALEAGKHVLVDKPVSEPPIRLGLLSLKKLLSLPPSSPQSIGDVVEFETHFDRFRRGIKNTWKDEPAPGSGHTFDLGTHLMDQVLSLFGRPDKITAFIQNSRGVGHPDVDDSFTIFLHYAASATLPRPVTAIARAQLLSVRSAQPRYSILGTKGSYIKFGVDPQEDQLKVIASPKDIHAKEYGVEDERIWGTLENVAADDVTMTKTTWPSEPGCYADLFRNLAAVIREGAEQAVKWEESASVIEMVELAKKSSKEGVTVVVPK
ncbi:unnamed protein product [Mycena citricolor]|uniref:NAD(P)-binding protein n=1 Tax=Mycena citricolor TaxID=2018698 RepID=A0AAD2HL01_9AGAR|nr:unnamed protein product [Mycena citricolor]